MKGCVSKVIFAVDAGPKGKEQPCGDFLAVACSTMKGGVSTVVRAVNISPVGNQQLYYALVALGSGPVKRCDPIVVLAVNIGTMGNQQLDCALVALASSPVQRRATTLQSSREGEQLGAQNTALLPTLVSQFTSAPRAISSSVVLTPPLMVALRRGVSPLWFLLLISAPLAISSSAMLESSLNAAQ
eukprot:m.248189 g.248189  ORF g.248189 m.248189 type:complete len:186 (-) comp10972_c0_seq2:57-614(-)